MDWVAIGGRIRKQREYLGLTREQFAEKLDITPKFCSDIELGIKGMSVPTLCRIASTLSLSTDYILFGTEQVTDVSAITDMLSGLDGKYLPELKELLGAYLKTITIAENQND